MKKFTRREFLPLVGLAAIGTSCISATSVKNSPTKLFPQKLVEGDTIGIAAPSGGVKDRSEVDDFVRFLRNKGFNVKLGKNAYHRVGYFSAEDHSRAQEFMELIQDPEVRAIFTTRGGWGAARILEHLDFEMIKLNPKIILGFSDLSSLLNAISSKTGLVTFHGPNGYSTWNDYSWQYIEDLLLDGETKLFENSTNDQQIVTYSKGITEGDFYGGNLSVLTGILGSNYLPDWRDKILFLEEIKEEPYRIDRMLTQLKLNGVFDEINGLVLGSFRKCLAEEPEYSFTLEEVFQQHFSSAKFPVFHGAQIGHIRNKFTVPIGSRVQIDASKGTIQILQAAVI